MLKGETPLTERPGAVMPPADLGKLRAEAEKLAREGETIDDEDFNGYLMYPKVFSDYFNRHRDYGPVRTLPTPVYFYGMQPGQEISVEIDPGKTLEVRLQAVGETNEEGDVRVFFELNGQPRTVRVPNRKAQASAPKRPKAEVGNPNHVAAPMPGVIASVAVAGGPAGEGGRPDADDRGDEDGDRALRRQGGDGEGACTSSRGRRSTRRTCWWRSPRPDAAGPRATGERRARYRLRLNDSALRARAV